MSKAKKTEAPEELVEWQTIRTSSKTSQNQRLRSLIERFVRQFAESTSQAIDEVAQAVARPLRARVALYEDKENGGYTAVLTALPGCVTEGETREEALASLREALEIMLLCRSGTFELLEGGVEEEVDL